MGENYWSFIWLFSVIIAILYIKLALSFRGGKSEVGTWKFGIVKDKTKLEKTKRN